MKVMLATVLNKLVMTIQSIMRKGNELISEETKLDYIIRFGEFTD